jgi:hypothetical protein
MIDLVEGLSEICINCVDLLLCIQGFGDVLREG